MIELQVQLQSVLVIFVSIVLEALPFVFLGTLIAGIVHVWISSSVIERVIPKNPFLSYPLAWVLGIVFPVCECVTVPLLKQFLKKWVPVGVGVTFMAAAPIVNPLVMMSTRFAFFGTPSIFRRRIVWGCIAAIIVGVLFHLYIRKKDYLPEHPHNDNDTAHHCWCDHDGEAVWWRHFFEYVLKEFTTIAWYLIVWAGIASLFKIFLPVSVVQSVSSVPLLELLALQLLAVGLSLCSEADAFIARTFQGMFSDSSILGFLLLGPMIDLKNMLMLRTVFSRRTIFILLGISMGVTWTISLLYFGSV